MSPHVPTLTDWIQAPWLIKAVGTLLILLGAFVAGRLAKLLLKRILHEFAVDKHVRATTGHRFSLERQLSTLLAVLIYIAGILIAASHLGILDILLLVLGGIIALFLIITAILTLGDDLPNVIAAITLKYRKAFKPGDTVTIRDITGTVRKLGPRTTIIAEGEDDLHVPNKLFLKEDYKVRRRRTKN